MSAKVSGLTQVPWWGPPIGVIHLPYAEIEEPFEAWYNETGNKSRIQYYGGKQLGTLLFRAGSTPVPRQHVDRGTMPSLLAQGR